MSTKPLTYAMLAEIDALNIDRAGGVMDCLRHSEGCQVWRAVRSGVGHCTCGAINAAEIVRRLLATARAALEDAEEFAQRAARAEKDTRRLDYIEQRRLHTYGAGWIDDGTPLRDLIDAARGVSTTPAGQVSQSDTRCPDCGGVMPCDNATCLSEAALQRYRARHPVAAPSSEGGK